MAYKNASRHQQYVANYGFEKNKKKQHKEKNATGYDEDGYYRDTTIRAIYADVGCKCVYFKCIACNSSFSIKFEEILHVGKSNTILSDVLEKARCLDCESKQLIASIVIRGKRIIVSHNFK
jgi:hypothetical protein